MAMIMEDNKRTICGTCNRVVMQLVPMYDNDQKHQNLMLCRECKRAIKKGENITKFKRDSSIYAKVEAEFNRQTGKREVVTPK